MGILYQNTLYESTFPDELTQSEVVPLYKKLDPLKVVSTTVSLVCFVCPTERTCETKKKCFLFHFESSLCFRDNQILNFQIFTYYNVIKCLSMKHETHFLNNLGSKHSLVMKSGQFM